MAVSLSGSALAAARTTLAIRNSPSSTLSAPSTPTAPNRLDQCRSVFALNGLPAQNTATDCPLARHAFTRAVHFASVVMPPNLGLADHLDHHGVHAADTFDPYAPPESVKLFPKSFTHLVCPPPPPKPAAAVEPKKKEEAKEGDKKPVGTSGGASSPDPKKKKDKDKDKAEEEPPGLPPPLSRPPPPEWHPSPPKGGVTASWPGTVLPIVQKPALLPSVESGHGVLPIAGLDGRGTVLPMAGARPPPSGSETARTEGGKSSTGDGTKKAGGEEKTAYEKWCEQVGLLGGVANLQLNEDIKAPGGSKYGIPGGKNPNGIKSPTAQAAAGAVMVAAAVITAGGFDKKLYDALKKGTPFFIRGGGKAAEQAAEKLVQDAIAKYGKHGAEDLAAALAKNGAIGEYSVMAKFTQGLGARWQAHHILEKKMVDLFRLGAADRVPAVILSEAEHKAVTALLKQHTANARSVAALWAGYQRAYAKYPAWLQVIGPYFGK